MSQIDELRQIIVGANAEQLAELKERIENVESRTADVLEVLPPAIDAGIKQDNRLIDSLKRPVSDSLKHAIRAEPTEYAEILYPVMGPSIRRAIAQAISSLLVTINQSVESATSVKGIRLRVQSMRTGIPYAELALRQSLQFKVEHVYLIDRDSGMMLAEVAGEGSTSLDSDAVSAMFSAIQSFVQDSFSQNTEDRLTDFKVGAHNVWIAHGPKAMLACVIFGEAPESLKFELYDVLDKVRTDYSAQINAFNGDSSVFDGVEQELKPLLQLRMKDDHAQQSSANNKKPSLAKWVLSLLLAAVLGYFVFAWLAQNARQNLVEHYLKDVPGLVMTEIYSDDGKVLIKGLQDPLAQIPYDIMNANGIDEDRLELQTAAFRSLDPGIEMQRLTLELAPPVGVDFKVEQAQLLLSGYAPIEWLLLTGDRLKQLAIENRLDTTQLYPSVASLRDYFSIHFSDLESDLLEKKIIEIGSQPWIEQSLDSLRLIPE